MKTHRTLLVWTLLVAAGCGASTGTAPPDGTGPGGTTAPGESGTTAPLRGIALPQEVSAVPPKPGGTTATSTALRTRSFLRLGAALTASSLPATSDYATASTVKWVNERALSRFDILNSIFKAVGQTHYADAENVGAGPYAALVTAVGDGEDAQSKTLQTWVLSSSMEKDADGHDVNVVHVWLEDDRGTVPVVIRIRSAPTQNVDGSYADYGVWALNADLSQDGSRYFVASAEVGADGASVVKVHNTDGGDGDVPWETRGILHKSGAAGYGKVSFPDSSQCHAQPCGVLPTMTVAYAYDAHHVRMELASGDQREVVVKDRDTVVDLVDRYGLFDADGVDVARTHRFGFPFRQASGAGSGYYGAWQGRHQLWANGASIAPGTTVIRADRRADAAPETYTASAVYEGILVRRSYTPATLDDIRGVVVGAWDFQNFVLQGTGTSRSRYNVTQPAPGQPMPPPACDAAAFTDFASLVADAATGATVRLDGSSPGTGGAPPAMTGLAVASSGDGFVVAGTSTPFAPLAGANVGVNVGGPIWIVWDGTAWMRQQVLAIDPMTRQPTFGPNATPYVIPDGRELYLNVLGVNYVVQCAGGRCAVQLETQTVANPANVVSFVGGDTTLTQQSWGQTPSTYRFVVDPADARFMKLVYASVGTQDQAAGARPEDVVTTSQWGIAATIGGAQVQFNWDYPDPTGMCIGCGVQQFLLDGQGQVVRLDDPIRLAATELTDGAGAQHRYALQFDGSWVGGLPDVYGDLMAANGSVTPAIQAKAVAIPSGTVVADATDSTRLYVFKQLAVSEYLATVADPGGLDLSAAAQLDLSSVPQWAPTGLGPKPSLVPTRYSEGKPLQ